MEGPCPDDSLTGSDRERQLADVPVGTLLASVHLALHPAGALRQPPLLPGLREVTPPRVFPAGHVVSLPDMVGRWQVWSQSMEAPGAYFFVPFDDEAHESGIKFVVGKAIQKRMSPFPEITVLRIERKR